MITARFLDGPMAGAEWQLDKFLPYIAATQDSGQTLVVSPSLAKRRKYFEVVHYRCVDGLTNRTLEYGVFNYSIISLDHQAEIDSRDAERYRKLRELHWTDGGLVVTDASTLKAGDQTYTRERLDEQLDSI